MKFTPRNGEIVVTAATRGTAARISIQDSGQPFWQGDAAPLRAHGLGLGLALVREIVELHGGAIEVNSRGHGTTFMVELPRHATSDD